MSACNVHEWPDPKDYVRCHVRLNYNTDMTEWDHLCENENVGELGVGDIYDNHLESGIIRYIIRTYPISKDGHTMQNHMQEFVFTKDIASGYDHEVSLDIIPGNYNIMVWSDLLKAGESVPYYDAVKFTRIRLQGDYAANTDYRDSFRGLKQFSFVSDITEKLPDTLDIQMCRPVGKFEFIAKDVKEFVDKEYKRIYANSNSGKSAADGNVSSRSINLEDYKVVFSYVGFMPSAYSIHTDRPVDSSTGVIFESTLKKLTESEATMGFDYVFVRDNKSSVTIQYSVCDNTGKPIMVSKSLDVPVGRDYHTRVFGYFLTATSRGGTLINPDYNGEYNLIFP